MSYGHEFIRGAKSEWVQVAGWEEGAGGMGSTASLRPRRQEARGPQAVESWVSSKRMGCSPCERQRRGHGGGFERTGGEGQRDAQWKLARLTWLAGGRAGTRAQACWTPGPMPLLPILLGPTPASQLPPAPIPNSL